MNREIEKRLFSMIYWIGSSLDHPPQKAQQLLDRLNSISYDLNLAKQLCVQEIVREIENEPRN